MSCTPNDLGLVLFSRSFCLAESKSTVPPHALRYTDFLDRLLKPARFLSNGICGNIQFLHTVLDSEM